MLIISHGEKLREGGVKELMAAEQMSVNIKSDNKESVLVVLQTNGFDCEIHDDYVRAKCEESKIPELTKKIVDAGFSIYEVKQLRTLEEYFIQLTA